VNRRIALALACLLGSFASVAPGERLPIRTFQITDGLAGDAVRGLLRDSRGFLWIATSSGLSRFDGAQFVNYGVAQGLPSPRISGLAETRDGAIWAASVDGLARLDAGARRAGAPFARERLPTELQSAACVLAGSDGTLWVGGPKLLHLDPAERGPRRWETLSLPSGDADIDALAEDRDGNLWVGTTAGLVLRRPGGAATLIAAGGPILGIRAIVIDASDRLWIADFGGLFVIDRATLTAESPGVGSIFQRSRRPRYPGELPSRPGEALFYDATSGLATNHIYSLSLAGGDRSGVWVATNGGVTELRGGQARNLGVEQGLTEMAQLVVLEDPDGTVWFGGESRGLSRLRPSGFVAFGEADGLAGDRAVTLMDGPDGALYVVTGSRELHRFDERGRFERITPRALFPAHASGWGWNQFALFDRGGALWFPVYGTLARFAPVEDPRALRHSPIAESWTPGSGLPGSDIFRLFEDRAGDIWVSIIDGSPLVRVRRGGSVLPVPQLSQGWTTGGAPTAFVETPDGALWIGFYLGVVARVKEGAWRFFRPEAGAPWGQIGDFLLDRSGRLWFATSSGGAIRIDHPEAEAPTFRAYSTAQGLASDNGRCLAEDEQGRIYLGSSRGVDRIDPERDRVRSYSTEDGLPNANVWDCHARRDGSIWFGTLHGLARFEPGLERPSVPPEARIFAVRVGGREVAIPELGTRHVEELTLTPDQNSLQVDFATVALDSSARPWFEYRLADVDDSWSPPTRERSVTFSRLGAGRYRFEVRAKTQDGLAEDGVASVSFRVVPPFWRRPLFAIAVAAVGLLLAWLFERLRVARLLAVERARTRIASDLHDDVGASVSRIGLLGELARRRLAAEPEAAESILEEISRESRELAETTSDIVWAVDPQRDDLASLAVRLRRFAVDLLEARSIQFEFAAPPDAASVDLDPEIRRALYLCVKESIHNVAKHSGAERAFVGLAIEGGSITAEIRDDGVGIAPERAAEAESIGRRGLPGLRRRAAEVGGSVEIESAPGRGTRVVVRLPLQPLSHRRAMRGAEI